jgi:pimeloyl-ACP methyl ester carboxylesterase
VAELRRYGQRGDRPPVLLIHGATAWSGTFLHPQGGFVRHLLEAKEDVWTLDWRASKLITDPWRRDKRNAVPTIHGMTLDQVIEWELPAAIEEVGKRAAPPRVVAHCMGAAAVAWALARKKIGVGHATAAIDPNILLSTIGLFYRTGVDSWFRAHDHAVDELVQTPPSPDVWALDPDPARAPANAAYWPGRIQELFSLWLHSPYRECKQDFCQRLSFMFGSPYRPDSIPRLHDHGLRDQFGLMPLSLLLHIAQSIRRGWIGRYGAGDDWSAFAPEPFAGLRSTLITGSENQLWYREAIDRMYEWLRRDVRKWNHGCGVRKRIFPRFGHQDLWWHEDRAQRLQVYEYVRESLAWSP